MSSCHIGRWHKSVHFPLWAKLKETPNAVCWNNLEWTLNYYLACLSDYHERHTLHLLCNYLNISFYLLVSLSLSHLKTLFEAATVDNLWKHFDKRRNSSKQAISHFAKMILTYFSNYIFIFMSWVDIIKVVLYRFVVRVKVSTFSLIQMLLNSSLIKNDQFLLLP